MTSEDSSKIDPAVVDALYAEHGRELRAFLTGVLRNPDLADEVVQVTMTRTLESGHTARKESMKGWLFRVAYNEAMAIRRRQSVHVKSMRQLTWLRPVHAESSEVGVDRAEEIQRVRSELKTLPVEQQIVVRMRIDEGKTFAIIASELNVPLGTVLTRMRLAIKKLQAQLKPEDPNG